MRTIAEHCLKYERCNICNRENDYGNCVHNESEHALCRSRHRLFEHGFIRSVQNGPARAQQEVPAIVVHAIVVPEVQ